MAWRILLPRQTKSAAMKRSIRTYQSSSINVAYGSMARDSSMAMGVAAAAMKNEETW